MGGFGNIGFGKAGGNPYMMGALGTGLLTGGQGLIPMLMSSFTGQDPQQEREFLAASEASGKPVSEIPRSGLLGPLLAKAGILSPNVQASPYVTNLEQIDLQQQQAQKMSDMIKMWSAIADAANKGGTTFAGQMVDSIRGMPGMSEAFAGFNSAGMSTPMELKAKAELAKEKQDTIKEAETGRRLDQNEQRIAISQEQANTSAERAATEAGRATNATERQNRLDSYHEQQRELALYDTAISQFGADVHSGLSTNPAQMYVRNLLLKNRGRVPYQETVGQILADPNLAAAWQTGPAPEQASGKPSWTFGGLLGHLIPPLGSSGPAPASASPPTASQWKEPNF